MMKARQYNRRILNGENTCHVYAIQESNSINCAHLKYFGAGMDDIEKNAAKMQLEGLLDTLTDAKEYGSILNVESYNWDLLRRFVATEDTDGQISMDSVGVEDTAEQLNRLIDIGETMARKYWVTCTNPPYAGTGDLNSKLNSYIKKHYADSKSDMYAVFIERCALFTNAVGFQAMITQHSWMFQSTFKKLREKILTKSIINMVHLGARAFDEIAGEVVQTTSFVLQGKLVANYIAKFSRLLKYAGEAEKEKHFLLGEDEYSTIPSKFLTLPDMQIAYWVSSKVIDLLSSEDCIANYGSALSGLSTSDNERFLRIWEEVSYNNISFNYDSCESTLDGKYKWVPHNKGGSFRRWYGNRDYVVNWRNDGEEIKIAVVNNPTDPDTTSWSRRIFNWNKFFKQGISWSDVATGKLACRFIPAGAIFNATGPTFFANDRNNEKYLLALFNSNVFQEFLNLVCPGLHYNTGPISKLPVIFAKQEKITALAESNIEISRKDWDSFEASWDFKKHPLLRNVSTISEAFAQWQVECDDRFNRLKANEEELNRIFIDIYGLQDELTPEVEDKDVTVRKADLQRDIKSLLSYAVGCMFGRYSTYKDGLLFAGEPYSLQAFVDKMNDRPGTISDEELERAYRNEGVVVDEMFFPDADNVIPITDEEYLDDDIVSRLCAWLKAVYGADTLEENLDYIAKALGNKGSTSREIIRNYFLNDFFKDHCQTYSVTGSGKRPIYWLFDSGKQNGFKALVYLHRYTPDTIGNLRIDYLHKMQRVYESEINRMQDMMDHSGNAREVAAASKRKDKLAKQLKECREYDEKISHLALSRIELDLDDGVKVNYRKLQTAQDGKFYEVLADSKNIMVKEKK